MHSEFYGNPGLLNKSHNIPIAFVTEVIRQSLAYSKLCWHIFISHLKHEFLGGVMYPVWLVLDLWEPGTMIVKTEAVWYHMESR